MLEAAEKEREAMRAEAESAAVRVDRLEREVDYLETQNPAPPCVEVDETLMDKQVATAKQRKNEKYTKLTGEGLLWLPGGWPCLRVTLTLPSPPQSRCPPATGVVSQQGISGVSGTSSCIPPGLGAASKPQARALCISKASRAGLG